MSEKQMAMKMKYFVPEEHILRSDRCCHFFDIKSGISILSFSGFVFSTIGFLIIMAIGIPGLLVNRLIFSIWMSSQAVASMYSLIGITTEKASYIVPLICMLFFNALISFGLTVVMIFIPVTFEYVGEKVELFFTPDIKAFELFPNYWWLVLIPFCLFGCFGYWCYSTYIYFEYQYYVECEDLYRQKRTEYGFPVDENDKQCIIELVTKPHVNNIM